MGLAQARPNNIMWQLWIDIPYIKYWRNLRPKFGVVCTLISLAVLLLHSPVFYDSKRCLKGKMKLKQHGMLPHA